MKQKLSLAFFFIFAFLFFPKAAHASVLYLSPGSGSIYNGATSYIQVRLNTQGDSINAVSAYLTYTSNTVQVVGLSYGGSFSIGAEGAYGSGIIHISRGNFSGVIGDINVATIAVRGLSLGSSASFSFTAGSHAARASDSSDSLNLGGSSGGIYTIVPAPTASPINTIAPKITGAQVSYIATNSATISWKTDIKSVSLVEYGLEKDQYAISTGDETTLTTDHSATISGPLIIPGETYHLRIISKDADGNTGYGDDMTIHFLGFTVTFLLNDTHNLAIANTPVTLYSIPVEGRTDSKGTVTFTNVSPGKHLLVVHFGNADKTIAVSVSTMIQTIPLHVTVPKTEPMNFQPLQLIPETVFLLGILFAFLIIRFIILPHPQPISVVQTETN